MTFGRWTKWIKAMISLFVCLFSFFLLSGNLFAKTTLKKVDEATNVYVVQKGDTLSGLAVKYFGSAAKWREFEKYNEFTNVNLILPGEKLQVPLTPEEKAKLAEAKKAPEVKEVKEKEDISAEQKEKMAELQKKLEAAKAELKSLKASMEDLKAAEAKAKELKAANEKLHEALVEKDKQVSDLANSINNLQKTIQSEGQKFSKSLEGMLAAARSVQPSTPGVGQKEVEKLYEESEEVSKKVSQLETTLSKVSSQIGSLQETVSAQPEAKPKAEEDGPKLSKKAKSAALITTLVGAAIWIVANAISSTE